MRSLDAIPISTHNDTPMAWAESFDKRHGKESDRPSMAELERWFSNAMATVSRPNDSAEDWARRFYADREESGLEEVVIGKIAEWFHRAMTGARIDEHRRVAHALGGADRLTAAEAVYGLLAWLTCRERVLTVSAKHEAGQVVKLAEMFIETNKLGSVRPDYAKHLTHPKEEPLTDREIAALTPEIPSLEMVIMGAGGDYLETVCTFKRIRMAIVSGRVVDAIYEARYCVSVLPSATREGLRYATLEFPIPLTDNSRSITEPRATMPASECWRDIKAELVRRATRKAEDECDASMQRVRMDREASRRAMSTPVTMIPTDPAMPPIIGIGPEPYHPGRTPHARDTFKTLDDVAKERLVPRNHELVDPRTGTTPVPSEVRTTAYPVPESVLEEMPTGDLREIIRDLRARLKRLENAPPQVGFPNTRIVCAACREPRNGSDVGKPCPTKNCGSGVILVEQG